MNILVCDDNINDLTNITNLLELYNSDNTYKFNIYSYQDPKKIIFENTIFDIAFIDIEMPYINGLEITRYLQSQNNNIIVFVITSYQGYLDEAMDLNVYRYISKPVDKIRFMKSLNSAVRLSLENDDKIVISNSANNTRTLFTINILYLSISKRNTIFTTKNEIVLSNKKFTHWKKEVIDYNYFAQPHYSYIVNLKYVTNFDRKSVTLTYDANNVYKLPVSRSFYMQFKLKFYEYMGGLL